MTFLSNSSDCPSCGAQHKSKPFCVYQDGFHCFSCGYTKRANRDFSPSNPSTKPELAGITGELTTNYNDFSLLSKAWLTKYYMTEQHVHNNSVFEINEHGKIWLIMPNIEENGNVLFYQKRCMNERGFLSSGPKKQVYKQNFDNGLIILVEDFISYCRVGALYNCVCLFGTNLSNEETNYIAQNYQTILVWLDNDAAKETNSGQIAANKICKNLDYALYLKQRRYGFTKLGNKVINVVTEMDPKCYSDTEIKQIVASRCKELIYE